MMRQLYNLLTTCSNFPICVFLFYSAVEGICVTIGETLSSVYTSIFC